VASETVKAFEEANILPRLETLIVSIGQRRSNPGDIQFDQKVSAAAKDLFEGLQQLKAAEYPNLHLLGSPAYAGLPDLP
jgi:hypothetical protein